MNDMVESLKAQVDDYKQREAAAAKAGKKVGGGLFSVDAADIAAAIAGGSRSGGGGGRWSMDTASTVPSKCRFHVKAHHTEINSVAYSDTEPGLVFTGSSDGTVKAWDGQTSRCRATLRGTSGGRSGGGGGGLLGSFGGGGGGGGSGSSASAILCVDSHEAIVVGASTDRTVKVWDLHSERLKTSVTGHSNKVRFTVSRSVSQSVSQSVNQIKSPKGNLLSFFSCTPPTPPSHSSSQKWGMCLDRHCVRLSSLDGGRVMVSGSTDRTLRAWDTPTGRETKTMRAPSSCNALDLSAVDSGVVVSGHQDGSVRLWDLRSGEQVAVAEKVHEGQVTSCRFSPPGSAGVGGSLPAILTAGRGQLLPTPGQPQPRARAFLVVLVVLQQLAAVAAARRAALGLQLVPQRTLPRRPLRRGGQSQRRRRRLGRARRQRHGRGVPHSGWRRRGGGGGPLRGTAAHAPGRRHELRLVLGRRRLATGRLQTRAGNCACGTSQAE